MNLITKSFAKELTEKEMRDAYLSAQTRTYLAYQIRTNRAERGWSQGQFAEKLDTSQSAVSRMEDRQYGKLNLQTLLDLASAFDCGLVVQFVAYADFIKNTSDLSPDHLKVSEFSEQSLSLLFQEEKRSDALPPALKVASKFVVRGELGEFWKRIMTQDRVVPPDTRDQQINTLREENARQSEEIVRLRADNLRLRTAVLSPAADSAMAQAPIPYGTPQEAGQGIIRQLRF
jgi:transcriptional regulator with XRE-family HTH domain